MPNVRSALSYSISQYVMKIHSRCDLACNHCYVYEHADQSWSTRPRVMSADTVVATAERIAEHAALMGLPSVHVVLHGGEPLLMGYDRLRQTLSDLRRIIEPATVLRIQMQTNGVLLSDRLCELFAEYEVRVGVSMDGDRAANDRHRVYASGASSYEQVRRALALLRSPRHRGIYAGILCTVDIANDPVAVYDALAAEAPPAIDLLLPHATWDGPPSRPDGSPTAYADWLLAVYDRWTAAGRPMSIRLFDSLHAAADGRPSTSEWVGVEPVDLLVVETDGMWEQADTMKTAFAGAPETGRDVVRHSVAQVAEMPEIIRRQIGRDALSSTCRACPVVAQCGGGLFAHRYRTGRGFDNPSVYCSDLKELVMTINRRLGPQAAERPIAAERPMTADVGRLEFDLIERIASGHDDVEAVARLSAAQLGYSRALLAKVAAAGAGDPYAVSAWELLSHLDAVAPDALRATLGHPFVRPWAVRCLGDSAAADGRGHAYLANIAAAAAMRAGLDWSLRLRPIGDTIHLPGAGSLLTHGEPADVTCQDGYLTVRTAGRSTTVDLRVDGPMWRRSTRVDLDGRSIVLEDADPFRDCHDFAVPQPLSATDSGQWARDLRDAWTVVETEAPHRVPGMRVGLRAVVPLATDPTGRYRSSTARHAFGSVAAAHAPVDALAVMLVHEFQHTVLGALLDVHELYDPLFSPRLTVAWRPDPRPLEGALQGTFAHFAVAEMWRVRAERDDASPTAREQFQQYRAWTAGAVEALVDCGGLTPGGKRFVSQIDDSLASWQ